MRPHNCRIDHEGAHEPGVPRVGQTDTVADGAPEIDPATKKPILIGPDGKRLTAAYDPDTMALFHDIVFSPGYQ